MEKEAQIPLAIQISAPITTVYRRALEALMTARSPHCALKFKDRADSLDQQLDVGVTAELAAAVFALIGLIMDFQTRKEGKNWTLERVNTAIREESAKAFGRANAHPLRYAGMREFLEGNNDTCLVTVEIDDEDYVFVVNRNGSAIAIKLEQ
jgi:hypothetical protein